MAAKIDTDDLVTCPICFEQLKNPKCLPCLHTFCHLCLKSYIITQLGGEGQMAKEFPCPFCRQTVTITDPKLTSENIADSMPGSHLITTLIERSEEAAASHEDEKWCGPCFSDGEKTLGVSWCTQCSESFCENCVKYHKRLKKSKHELIPIEEKDTLKSKPFELLDVEEPCLKHTGEVLKVYCVGHKEMCCVICLATSHRRCEHISTFEEIVTSGSKDSGFIENFTDCLKDIEEKTDSLRQKTDKNLTTLNKRYDEIAEQVTTSVQQAKDKLDHLQSSFLTNFQQIHKKESINLEETKERLEIFQQSVKTGLKLLQTVQEQGSPKQVFITAEKLKVQLKHHMESLKVELHDAHWMEYILSMDDVIATVLNTRDSVAKINVHKILDLSTSLKELPDVVDCLYKEKQEPIDIMKLEVHLERTIKPGGQITGGTFLPDGRFILCCHTNKKLEVYDKEGNFLFNTSCGDRYPRNTCLISSSEIIVSFLDGINKYEIQQNGFKEMGQIPCKTCPWVLAATKDNIIVGYTSEIDVLSMDGNVVQNFAARGDYASYVAVSLTGNFYYFDGNDIVCKTIDGKEIRRFTNQKLKRMIGIAVDKYDNLFVCGNQSNNICVFSPDGKYNKMLISDIKQPINIGMDSTKTLLYIGTSKEGCHFYSLNKKD